MVFFVWVGGGPRALAASAGIFVFSLLLNGPCNDWLDPHGWDVDQQSFHQEHHGPWTARRPGHRHPAQAGQTWACTLLVILAAGVAAAAALLALVHRLAPRFPRLAQHPAVRRLQHVALWLEDAVQRLAEQLGESLAQGQWAGGGAPGHRARSRASAAEVQRLPTEVYVSEEELQRWSAARLKDELGRIQRLADMRMAFSGGSATRETQHFLRSGVAVEKPELVRAVLKARGGDSGASCAVCLADYESGAQLRLLPCGHRFHCQCVDRWLVQQSKTCPLCSKKV